MPYKDVEKRKQCAKLSMRRLRESIQNPTNPKSPEITIGPTMQNQLLRLFNNHVSQVSKYVGDYQIDMSRIGKILEDEYSKQIDMSLVKHLDNFGIERFSTIDEIPIHQKKDVVEYRTPELSYYFCLTRELWRQLGEMVSPIELKKIYKVDVNNKVYPNKKAHEGVIHHKSISLKKYLDINSVVVYQSKKELLRNKLPSYLMYVHKKQHIWFQLPEESPILTQLETYVERFTVNQIQSFMRFEDKSYYTYLWHECSESDKGCSPQPQSKLKLKKTDKLSKRLNFDDWCKKRNIITHPSYQQAIDKSNGGCVLAYDKGSCPKYFRLSTENGRCIMKELSKADLQYILDPEDDSYIYRD